MSKYEALAAEENIKAVLEKVRNMTSEEADAAVWKALKKCCLVVLATNQGCK